MSNQAPIQKNNYKFDLEERTANFSEALIKLIRSIKENSLNRNIISQLVRSGTSIGANYCEANDFLSKKDFMHRIAICRKEAKETRYWLRLLRKTCNDNLHLIDQLAKEAQELNLIFSAILIRSRNKQN